MVQGLEADDIKAYEQAQKTDVLRRQDFLHANRPTQRMVVSMLATMSNLIHKKDQWDAQYYFFRVTSRHRKGGELTDQHGVDWDEVHRQILYSCFGDHDMDGYTMFPERVDSQLTVYRSLMGLPSEHEDF